MTKLPRQLALGHLGLGTDICQIGRIYAILQGPRRRRFLHRILTAEERAGAGARLEALGEPSSSSSTGWSSSSTGWSSSSTGWSTAERARATGAQRRTGLWRAAAFVAGRFAAKEAVFKAHPQQRLGFQDVTVEGAGGPPAVRIGGGGRQGRALVSISHDGDYATAVCLALGGGG